MQRINEDIKNGEFKQIYLLYGEEAYLRKQYKDKLRAAMTDGLDTMNVHYEEGKDISTGGLIDLAETLPFFADRRVIVIENSGLFKQGGEALAQYLTEPAPSVCFIFAEAEIDKRSKLYKAVQNKGCIVEFPVQTEATLMKWVLGLLGKEGKKITEASLRYFLEKTGTDMENIKKELEKLVCYCMDKTVIEKEDIDAIGTPRISGHIFDMIEAIARKRQKEALDLYYELLALREPAMRILFLIARQFNLLLQVQELRAKGYDNRKIGEKTGLAPFIASKYMSQAQLFNGKELMLALEECVTAEEEVKTGKISDILSVELLIVKRSKGRQ